MLEDEVAKQRETRIVLRNGPHEVSFPVGELSDDDVRRVTEQVDRLQRIAPVDRLRLSFQTRPFEDDEGNPQPFVMGRVAERGVGNIGMQVRALGDWDPPIQLRPDNHFMPSAETVDQFTYILTHEWGHAIDSWSHAQAIRMYHSTGSARGEGMSLYGQKNQFESIAEAFAEWVLTRGHPTTPAAQEYAAVFEDAFAWRWGDASPWD